MIANLVAVAIRASREVVIEAPPEVIVEALADMDAVPSWSSVHKRVEVVDTYSDGRPHHVKVTIKVAGIVDTELLEYHWGRLDQQHLRARFDQSEHRCGDGLGGSDRDQHLGLGVVVDAEMAPPLGGDGPP